MPKITSTQAYQKLTNLLNLTQGSRASLHVNGITYSVYRSKLGSYRFVSYKKEDKTRLKSKEVKDAT